MDQILRDLGELLLKAVPTFLLVGLLYFYLKRVFFRPLEQVLETRRQATEGARQLAEETSARVAEKTDEYQAALRAARAEIYQEQEQARRGFEQAQAAAVQQAKREAQAAFEESVRLLATEVAEARQSLEGRAAGLAAELVGRILARRAA